jgi:hypothetical protein
VAAARGQRGRPAGSQVVTHGDACLQTVASIGDRCHPIGPATVSKTTFTPTGHAHGSSHGRRWE